MAAAGFEPATNTIAIMEVQKINELGVFSSAHLSLKTKQTLSARSYFTVTITAIYWSVLTWLERYFGLLAALGTNRGEHLTIGRPIAVVIVSRTFLFPCLTTFGTTFGLVGVASGLE